MRFLLIALVLVSASPVLWSQHEYDTWFFGERAGIRFQPTGVTSVRGPINTEEGASVWCDRITGIPLLSTDGSIAYDSTGSVLINGTDLGGGYSSTNSALIVPDPANDKRFYIFCAGDLTNSSKPDITEFSYSIADMSMGAQGTIIQKNTKLVGGTAEKVAGTMHCDAQSWWVVTHDTASNRFYSFRVTKSGITGPIISDVGALYTTPTRTEGGPYGIGYLKFNASGTQLAMASPFAHRCELFDFDVFTGIVSNPRQIDTIQLSYGLSFSPNGQFLYTVCWSVDSTNPSQVFQYDLQNGFSQFRVGGLRVRKPLDNGGIQRGPDGKIYLANGSDLRIISAPDQPQAACMFGARTPLTAGTNALLGLPTLMDCMFDLAGYEVCTPPRAAVVSFNAICVGSCITFTDSTIYKPTAWQWEFEGGNPGTFTGKTPPQVCYDAVGVYRVRLIATNRYGADTSDYTLNVVGPPQISAGPDVVLCDSSSSRLSASGGVRYEWTQIPGISNPFIANPIIRVFTTTQLVVRGWDATGCFNDDTVIVYVRIQPYPITRIVTSSLADLAGTTDNIYISRSDREYLVNCTLSIDVPRSAFLVDSIARGTVISDDEIDINTRRIVLNADLSGDTIAILRGMLLLHGIEETVDVSATSTDSCIHIGVADGTVYSDACFVDGRIVRKGQHPLQIIRIDNTNHTIDISAEPRSEFELSLWTLQGELVGMRSGVMRSPLQSISFGIEFPQMMFVKLRSGEWFVVESVLVGK